MTTTLSSKGQVVIPRILRSRLHLVVGTRFRCEVVGDSVILTPEHPARVEREQVVDARTGLRVVKARTNVEPVTTEMVQLALQDYP